ncbi:hypothetical protein [Kribbella sindirgiensis]|uniref:Outer membrane channel protein CpnT-like N-terminal domain-containing protein n=1 Tax=Kribbella sindirgiensis TaxID=1124744 RepID=A0A4R0IDN5_9ACTN|nr:hypothetical protein [Kribbella sindirgiensis]TCC22329.1 hypothetical protein E0H50_34695 [Kribbella sindirgiensis]
MIPEPTSSELWRYIRENFDDFFPVWVNEDAARRIGDNWGLAANDLTAARDRANTALGELPSAWPDARGVLYHANVGKLVNGVGATDGYDVLIQMMRDMAGMSHEYAKNIAQIKDQIYAELALNGLAFVAGIALPGIGALAGAAIAGGVVARIASLIRTLATAYRAMSAAVRVPTSFVFGAAVKEPLDEVLAEGIAETLDIARGYRQGYDLKQFQVAAGAGAGGAVLALPFAPVGWLASKPLGAAARRLPRHGDGIGEFVENNTQAFVVNGLTSPISSTAAQGIADGRFDQLTAADYGKAIKEQFAGSGLLASGRVSAEHIGGTLGNHLFPSHNGSNPAVVQDTGTPPIDPPDNPPGGLAEAGASQSADGTAGHPAGAHQTADGTAGRPAAAAGTSHAASTSAAHQAAHQIANAGTEHQATTHRTADTNHTDQSSETQTIPARVPLATVAASHSATTTATTPAAAPLLDTPPTHAAHITTPQPTTAPTTSPQAPATQQVTTPPQTQAPTQTAPTQATTQGPAQATTQAPAQGTGQSPAQGATQGAAQGQGQGAAAAQASSGPAGANAHGPVSNQSIDATRSTRNEETEDATTESEATAPNGLAPNSLAPNGRDPGGGGAVQAAPAAAAVVASDAAPVQPEGAAPVVPTHTSTSTAPRTPNHRQAAHGAAGHDGHSQGEHVHLFSRGAERSNQDVFENGGEVPMTQEAVAEAAAAGGVDLSGVEVVIVSDADEIRYLDYQGAVAYAPMDLPNQIRLGPASFATRETLVATLAHEKTHVDQYRAGIDVGTDNRADLETEAYASEAPALERMRAHDRDQVQGRDDVRSPEPDRDSRGGRAADRSDPGRDDAAGREHGGADPGTGRGDALFRRPGDAADRSGARGGDPQRDGADRGGLTPATPPATAAPDGQTGPKGPTDNPPPPPAQGPVGESDDEGRGPQPRRRAEGFVPGFLVVSAESGKAMLDPVVLAAAGILEVVDLGNGRCEVTTVAGDTFILIKRVGVLPAGTVAQYVAVPGASRTAEVTLSDRLALDEVRGVLARILAETASATLNPSPAQLAGTEESEILNPAGDARNDPRLKAEDHGALAEAHMLRFEHEQAGRTRWGRRLRIRRALAQLIASMGLGKDQPNTELLSTLVRPDDQALAERFQDRRSPKDNRPSTKAYVAKAVRTSVWSGLLTGATAYGMTGSPAAGIALAAPGIVYGLVGALAERWLDAHKSASAKPAYAADRAELERENPGLEGRLDGTPPAPLDPAANVPRSTERWRYLVRQTVPFIAAGGVGGVLALLGFSALPAVAVVAGTAAARAVTEQISDARKRDYRRERVKDSMRKEAADPNSVRNQLIRALDEQQQRLAALRAAIIGEPTDGTVPATSTTDSKSPTPPSVVVHGAVQLVDNDAAATARAANVKPAGTDLDPTDLSRHFDSVAEGIVAAFGPAILGGLLGAVGDKVFTDLEEAATAAQKVWDHARREAVRGKALIHVLAEPLQQLDQALQQLARQAGAHRAAPDLTDRAAGRGTVPTPPELDHSERPSRLMKYGVFVFQAGMAALGVAGGIYGLHVVLGLSPLTVATAIAGAVGAFTGGPIARLLFRKAELMRKDANAKAIGKYGVDQAELAEQAGIAKYLIAQLMDQIHQLRELLGQMPVSVSPTDAGYTDRVRAAVERAYLDNQTARPGESAYDLDVRRQRVAELERIDRLAAAVDWADAADPGSAEAADARGRLALAIRLYESIVAEDGSTKAFPDLRQVSPARGQRVTGGPMDQVRAGVRRALGRMLGEPAGKPLPAERLAALEAINEAANAVDAHADHATTGVGTEESHRYLLEELAERIRAFEKLQDKAKVLGRFPRPAISPETPPDAGPATADPNPPDPLPTPPGGRPSTTVPAPTTAPGPPSQDADAAGTAAVPEIVRALNPPPYVAPAVVNAADGPMSGVVSANDSRNRATWSFGRPGQPDEVVLELREVHAPQPLPMPDGAPVRLPPLALEWAFARHQVRALIPPGVQVPESAFIALEQQLRQLLAAGEELDVVLRALPGTDGRLALVLTVSVTDAGTAATKIYRNLSLPDMIDALGNHHVRPPSGNAAQRGEFVADGPVQDHGVLIREVVRALRDAGLARYAAVAAVEPIGDGTTVEVTTRTGERMLIEFTVGTVADGHPAEYHRTGGSEPAVVRISDRIKADDVLRAIVHEIRELSSPAGEATFTPHEQGRMGELIYLDQELQTTEHYEGPDPVRRQRYQAKMRELIEELRLSDPARRADLDPIVGDVVNRNRSAPDEGLSPYPGPVRLSEETVAIHILPRHGHGTPSAGTKFHEDFDISTLEALAREVVSRAPVPVESDSGANNAHEYDFGPGVVIGASGTGKVRVWVDPAGNVRTMFPVDR